MSGVMVGAVPGTNVRSTGRVALRDRPPAAQRRRRSASAKLHQAHRRRSARLHTKGVDLSISKGFLMFTPYAGIGRYGPRARPTHPPLLKESLSLNKVFVGANLNFGLMNLAIRATRTGERRPATVRSWGFVSSSAVERTRARSMHLACGDPPAEPERDESRRSRA